MSTYNFHRQIPTESGYDLIVAGGGPAGAAAAISAARLGAKTLLIEATGCLGGMGTSALVSAWSDLADGQRMLVGGLAREIIETMYARGFFRPGIDPAVWRTQLHGGMGFNAEGLKLLLDELAAAAGVETRFYTRVIDADCSGGPHAPTVNGVVINNIEGHRYLQARTFIDATGDAVLADLCRLPCFEAGRDSKDIMPPTLCAAQAGIDWSRIDYQTQQDAVNKALADGFFSQQDRHVPGLFRGGRTSGIMNAGHLFGTNALSCRSLSDGMIRGRRLAEEYTRFYRQYLGGCENMEFIVTGALLGIRESRRIRGEYELNYADYQARRSFPDQIAVYNKTVDIHVYDCSDAQYARYYQEFIHQDRLAAGEFYGLPYGILVPQGSQNLWVAGRCNSSDGKVSAAIRDQPACLLMGQAAGAAAVQSLRRRQPACTLDTAQLVETLRAHQAYLPQPTLTRTMTRP